MNLLRSLAFSATALACICGPAEAAGKKPLTLNTTTGQTAQLQPGDWLLFLAPTTSVPSFECPAGTAPTSPSNGQLWCTSAGMFMEVGGSAVGPFGTATLPSGAANLFLATPNGSSGAASLRAIVSADLPLGTNSVKGAVEGDGTTVTCSAGVCSAPGGTLGAIASHDLLSNITGISAVPIGNTLSDTIDAAIGSTQGDIIYRSSSGWTALGPGTTGQVLTTGGTGANPSWAAGGGGSGSVTSVGSACSLSGGPITSAGTLSQSMPAVLRSSVNSVTYTSSDCGTMVQRMNATVPMTDTLPAPTLGLFLGIRNNDSSAQDTVATPSGFIDRSGTTSVTIGPSQNAVFGSDGTNWYVIAGNTDSGLALLSAIQTFTAAQTVNANLSVIGNGDIFTVAGESAIVPAALGCSGIGSTYSLCVSAAGPVSLAGQPEAQFGSYFRWGAFMNGDGSQFGIGCDDAIFGSVDNVNPIICILHNSREVDLVGQIGLGSVGTGNYTPAATVMLIDAAAASISSGFCTSPSIIPNGSAAFQVTIGTSCSGSSGVITFANAASHGWSCSSPQDVTNGLSNTVKQTATNTTTATFTNTSPTLGTALNWTAADNIVFSCLSF